MNATFQSASLKQRLRPIFAGFDGWLLVAIFWLAALGLMNMYSAGYDNGARFGDHSRNMVIGFTLLLAVSQLPPQRLMQLAVPLYTVGVTLLVAVILFGISKKGAKRWLNVGVVIQPSEIMKLAMPLMLAWWFQKREGMLRTLDFAVAGILLALPGLMVQKQPDLGTAILVVSSGVYVLFFAGLRYRWIVPFMVAGAIGAIALIHYEPQICKKEVSWPLLKEYQKDRVCTLLDPTKDRKGNGFHVIQGKIAIGSGGITGKGLMQGTQTHLEFIPERTTDFAFAAFAEENGLLGCLALLAGFSLLIFRGLMIAAHAPTVFSRLMAGAVSMSLFTYVFVNMGMVSGILPVVGVPLPFISYGGTAMVTLGLQLGILMSIARSRRLMQS